MKVLIRKLGVRLQRLSPIAITAIGLGCLLALGVIDYFTPTAMSFLLFYMLVVVLVGWGAGKWHALFVATVAVITITMGHWFMHRGVPQAGSITFWNNSTYFVVFSIAGWLTAEVTRLTRHLSQLVEDRTAQWKAEVEHHKATSTRLQEILERFEQVINNITEVFWLTDVAKNQMAYISPGYERIWGRKAEELYREPRSWAAAIHPAERDEVLRRAQTDQAAGSYDVEYRILRPDGAVRWIRDRAFPVHNQQGEVYRIAGIADDITERKQTREVLQTQAAILENMAEAVVVTDEKGVVVQMNPAGERIWGYERSEVLGQPASVFSALPEAEATAVMQEVLAALQATGSWRGTFKNRRKDGAIIFCEAVISRLELRGRMLMVSVQQDVTERVRAQEQLQMQAHVLDSMAEAALMAEEDGTIILTNPALDALLGYERGELAGKPMLTVAGYSPEEYRRVFDGSLEQVKAHGAAAAEYIARRKDGSLIEVEARSTGVSVGGRFHLVVVGQDITERKRAAQVLRQSEATLRVFLDAVPEPAFLLNNDGTILASNQALAHTLKLPSGELAGKQIFGLLPAEIANRRRALFDQVIRNREPAQSEDTRAGLHFVNIASPVLDPAGNVTSVAVLALDITERKRAEWALASQEALYRTLFELSPDGILLEDTNGNILDANQALCRSFGYSRGELVGRNVRSLVPPEGQGEVEAHLAKLRAGQKLEHELWNLRKNGERCLMWLNEKPLALPDGRQGILAVARDITQSKRGELIRAVFLSLGTKLSVVRTPVEAAKAVYASADQLWQWDAASLHLYSQEKDWLDPVLLYDIVAGQRREVAPALPAGPPTARMRRIMEQGADLILRQEDDLQAADSLRLEEAPSISASIMCVPMRREGQPIGVLSIQSHTPYAYSQEDLRTLQALADYGAGALERIRAEQALQQREEFNRTILATAMDGFFTLDFSTHPGGAIIEVNDAYCRLIGYSREELLQLRMTDLEAAESPEEVTRHKAIIMAAGADRFETRHRRKDGQEIQLEISVSSLAGSSERVFGFVRDITERKRAEETLREAHEQLEQRVRERTAELQAANTALRESEARLRLALDASNAGVWSWDAVSNQSAWDNRYHELYGFEPDEPISFNAWIARVHPEDREWLLAAIQKLREPGGGDIWNEEFRASHPVKGERWMAGFGRVERDQAGRAVRLAGINLDITERKAMDQALKASEEKYRRLHESMMDAFVAVDMSGRITEVNAAYRALLGYTAEELRDLTYVDLTPEKWHAREARIVAEEILPRGYSDVYEKEYRRKDGTIFPVELRTFLIGDAEGQPAAMWAIVRDITQRKLTEAALCEARDELEERVKERTAELEAANAALAEKEERYRALAESSPDAIFILDRDIKVQYVNSTAAALWRRQPGDLIGLTQPELFPPEVAERHGKVVAEVFKTGKPVHREEPLAFPTGEQWIDIRLVPLHGEQGTVSSVMGVCRDITERKRAEEALRQSEARLRAIVTGAPVLLFAVDQDGIIRFEDGQAIKALGATPGANVGRSVKDVYAHVPVILANSRRALQGEEFESVVEAGPVTLDCWYSPTRDKEGKPAGYIGVATNITERHRLERQVLDISDREQARIGQDIHDGLCQQLVSLAFDANALLRALSAEKRPEAKTARRIARFLDQAITESRQLSRGLFPVRLGTMGLAPALHELANSTSVRFKIQCRFDTQGPAVVKHAGTATHLYRIAQEAVANAVKHGRARTVRIRLRAQTRQIELIIEDNGAGLSPAKQKKATGLGLHIMDYRARAAGGTLRIGPRRRGGTTVSCCVPRPRS